MAFCLGKKKTKKQKKQKPLTYIGNKGSKVPYKLVKVPYKLIIYYKLVVNMILVKELGLFDLDE